MVSSAGFCDVVCACVNVSGWEVCMRCREGGLCVWILAFIFLVV